MSGRYVLADDGATPLRCDDLIEWAQWSVVAERNDLRRIARDEIGAFLVSTVFLGLDHNFTGQGAPVLWETMIFGPEGIGVDLFSWRYTSRDDAELGHAKACELLRERVRQLGSGE